MIKTWLTILTSFIFLSILTAQSDTPPQDSVEVIKLFKTNLLNSDKIKFDPVVPAPDTTPRSYYYKIDRIPVDLPTVSPSLRPQRHVFTSPFLEAPGYLEAGIGFPMNTHFRGTYQRQGVDRQFAAYLNHQNLSNAEDYLDFSTTQGAVSGAILLEDKWEIEGTGGGARYMNQFFPLQSDTTIDRDDATRVVTQFNIGGKVNTFINDWAWESSLNFNTIKDSEGPRDNKFDLVSGVERAFNRDHLGITFHLTGHTIDGTGSTVDFHNSGLNLSYGGIRGKWKYQFAVQPTFADDKVFVLPEGTLQYSHKSLVVGLSHRSQLLPQSIGHTLLAIPWLDETIPLTEWQTLHKSKLQLSGIIGKLDVQTGIHYSNFENRYFWIQSVTEHLFIAESIDGQEWNANVRLHAEFLKNWHWNMTVSQSIFDLDEDQSPWQTPLFKASTMLKYKRDSWHALLSLEYLDGIEHQGLAENTKLDAIIDLGARVDYQWNDQWSSFIQLSNLLNQDNQRWFGYNQPPTLATIGLRYEL